MYCRFSYGIEFPVGKEWQSESAVFTLYNFVHAKKVQRDSATTHEIFDFRFTAGGADNGGNLPPESLTLHCEKSLFVLASRQKIPVLRTEIPAVDTKTICLLPIEFF
jgi:hypothetical protein